MVEMQEFFPDHSPSPIVDERIGPKISTSLSIPELAYLFKLLKEENIIMIPEGKAEEFYRIIADTFSSKQKDSISPSSFKNNFLDKYPVNKVINYWHEIFIHMTQRAKKDLG